LDFSGGLVCQKGLMVSIGHNKFDALEVTSNHCFYGVASAASNTNHFDVSAYLNIVF
jgi:hypothetical protein